MARGPLVITNKLATAMVKVLQARATISSLATSKDQGINSRAVKAVSPAKEMVGKVAAARAQVAKVKVARALKVRVAKAPATR